MHNACARARQILTLIALLCTACPIVARPLLVAPKQRLAVPMLVEDAYPATVYGPPAIDGDTLLVPATRLANTNGDLSQGVHLFQRGPDGTWSYVRELYAGQQAYPLISGDLAVIQIYTEVLVFERGTGGWAQTAAIPMDQGTRGVFRVEDASIYVRPNLRFDQTGCVPPYEQWRKVNGTWKLVATIGPQRCDDQDLADINDGRALIIHQPAGTAPAPPADIYAQNGTPAWSRVAGLTPARNPPHPTYSYYGRRGSLSGNNAFIESAWRYHDSGGNNWAGPNTLVEPEYELGIYSGAPKFRGNSLIVQGDEADYEIPSHDEDYPSRWSTLRVYRPRADGYLDYFARLSIDFNVWFWGASENGTRVAAVSPPDNFNQDEPTQLYVFEIPDTATFAGTQQDTFESGNLSKWTATVGQFSVVDTSHSRILRQSDLSGDAKAYFTGIDWTDQAIEADIRPVEFGGNDRWFGLATRRTDDQNYYYATYRYPGTVSLRRMRNGQVTVLANGYLHDPLVAGRSYRVRLESVGDQHAVFLDGFPVTHAKDSGFTHGHPGLVSYRTTFDADNVIMSSGTRQLLRLDTYKRQWANGFVNLTPGNWQLVTEPSDDVNEHGEVVSYVLRQGDSSGDVKWFSKIAAGNQVISARVRPLIYGTTTGTNDAWVGIAAHVVDDRNYYYLTLRRRNELSLRRMVNGQVQVIATVPQAAMLNSWYDLRLEIIGIDIRAYVNGDLKISARDPAMSGGGRNAILMYKTAADFYHYIAYQP